MSVTGEGLDHSMGIWTLGGGGGGCGVLAETMFYVPAENKAKFWYKNIISNLLCFPFTYMFVFLYEKVDC